MSTKKEKIYEKENNTVVCTVRLDTKGVFERRDGAFASPRP